MLRELETVAVVGIQLMSIDISMADHMATVELQADSDVALGDYLEATSPFDVRGVVWSDPGAHYFRSSTLPAASAGRSI